MHMQDVHLANLDLNLLVVLEALLAERHVSRAAARVGLSQSAMSHALARIREVFGDPMLVRTKEGMVPTARALSLEPLLRRALGDLAAAVTGGGPSFDPSTSQRCFTIGSTDYAEILLLPPLMARLRAGAPGVNVMVKLHPDDYVSALGVGAIDLAIAPIGARERDAVAISYEPLLKENFRCVVRRGHPLTRQRLTVARYVAYPHVMVAPQGTRWSFVDEALQALGKRRRVACTVPHFLVAPNLLGKTDLVLTLSERIVKKHMRHLDLVDLALPLTIPPFTLSMACTAGTLRSRGTPGCAVS